MVRLIAFLRNNFSFIIVTFLFTVAGIVATKIYSQQQFKDWQIKVATATSGNINLEQKVCDSTLRTINDKTTKIKNKNVHQAEHLLEYFDNLRNQIVILKDIITNSKQHWDVMFPEFTKKYTKEIEKIERYDRELLGLVAKTKELEKQIKLNAKSGEVKLLKESIEKLEKTTNLFEEKLQSYSDLPPIYPSSVASADSVTSGVVVLADGSLFSPSSLSDKSLTEASIWGNINLSKKYNLSATNKIIIDSNLFSKKEEKRIEITNAQTIMPIIKELETTKKTFILDDQIQHRIRFYSKDILLAELEYNDDSNFLKYKEYSLDDYAVPTEEFRNIIKQQFE